MKKLFLPLFFVFVFSFPLNLHAKKLFIKLTLGLIPGGNVEDVLLSPSIYSEYVAICHEKHSKLGQEIYLEFIYKLNPYFGFSIGNGYTHKTLKGKTSQYSLPDLPPDREQVFTVFPKFTMEAVPICFSSIFSFPVTSSIHVNFTGGVGYYFVKYECLSKWSTMYPTGPYFASAYTFKGNSNEFGFHFGAGFDIDISLNLFLTVDALYRIINLNNLKSVDLYERNTTSWYLENFIGLDFSEDYEYQLSEAGITGISVRVGLKFEF